MPEIAHRLEVESLDLGTDVRAVLLELIDPQTREPVTGSEAARIWAAIIPALAAGEPWVLDFFAHLVRVREFFSVRGIPFRERNVLLIEQPQAGQIEALVERFAGETFGVRAGAPGWLRGTKSWKLGCCSAVWMPTRKLIRDTRSARSAISRTAF